MITLSVCKCGKKNYSPEIEAKRGEGGPGNGENVIKMMKSITHGG